MRPVDQTTYGPLIGNCISACVGSILELPIETIPLFVDAHWWSRFLDWLAQRGLTATEIVHDLPRGFTIALGPSTRSTRSGHACVAFNGVIVHDPHPSREGLPVIDHHVAIHGLNGELMWFNG